MSKKAFSIIHNLERLTEQERTQYLRDASEHFGWDPNLNALDLIWMNDESSGLRKLTPYARRGSTDIWRETHDVEIKTIDQIDIPGTVSFKATAVRTYVDETTGRTRTRQEIGIGSHSTVGLTGEKLAAAVMTAETRAGRRVTLKFIGGGLLDDVEVNAQVSNIASQGASLAELSGSPVVMPAPQVLPNALPGKDITPPVDYHFTPQGPVPAQPDRPMGDSVAVALSFAEQQEKMRQEAAEFLKTKQVPETRPVLDMTTARKVVPVSEEPLPGGEAAAGPEPQKPPRKRGKKRGTVDIASPGQAIAAGEVNPHPPQTPIQTEMPVGIINSLGEIKDLPNSLTISQPAAPVAVPPPAVTEAKAEPAPAQAQVPAIPAEKATEYRNRLKVYSNDILPKGGMMPHDKIGGVTMKLRLFAAKTTGAADSTVLTVDQWDALFEFLDNNKENPKFLVDYIDKAIGAV